MLPYISYQYKDLRYLSDAVLIQSLSTALVETLRENLPTISYYSQTCL